MRVYSPTRPASLGVTLVVLAAVLAGCSTNAYEPFTAENAGQEEDEGLIKGLMTGMGAIDPRDKPIEYRPRAALVVPPKKDLRDPENADAALAARQFPTNPEERTVDRPKYDVSSGAMSLAEQQKFNNTMPRLNDRLPKMSSEDASKPLSPDKLAGDGNAQLATAKAQAQVARKRSLTDPPKEYATPSPNAPFEEEKPKESSWKPGWWPF